MNDDILEKIYQERLEEQLISFLSRSENLPLEEAMDLYYSSKLADKIHIGTEGVQYLDHKVLARILKETEPELFEKRKEV